MTEVQILSALAAFGLSALAAFGLSMAFAQWLAGRRVSRMLDRALDMTDRAIELARRAQDEAGYDPAPDDSEVGR